MATNENTARKASEDASEALLTYEELRRLLHLPLGTLYALVHDQRIPHLRLGKRLVRFRVSDVERWLAERAVLPVKGVR
jgi:excisionase family DNA binding protein